MMNATRSKKPNLLFVLVDQMRYHAMGCAGNPQVKTPNLDRMAAQGACFDLAVSNIPVCTPARACLLTGMYPLSHTVLTNNSMLPNHTPSIGRTLKENGYSTGYIGKWHLAGEAYIGSTKQNGGQVGYIPPGEMRHGFDYWAVHHCSHNYTNAFYFRDEPEPIHFDKWEPDGQTDLAERFISDHVDQNPDDPFALFVSWGTPHTPFIAPEEFKALYDKDKLEFRKNVKLTDLIKHCDYRSEAYQSMSLDDILRNHLLNYYAAISNIDHNMGRLLKRLERSGVADDTVVVFTSDHGEMMGSHGQMHKVQIWDESIQVPFLARFPDKIPAGTRVKRPFGQADVLPTLFGLMGLPIPSHVEGSNYASAFNDESIDAPTSSFLLWPCNATTWGKKWTPTKNAARGLPQDYMREYRGIRAETHTFVRDLNGPWYLYDNVQDPDQLNNLIETEGPAAIPPELERELDEWLERTGDGFEDTDYFINRIDLETGLATKPEEFKSR